MISDITFGDIDTRRLERVQVAGTRWHRIEPGTFRLAAGLSMHDPGAVLQFVDADDGHTYAANVEDLTNFDGDLVAYRHAPLPPAGPLDFDLPSSGRLTVADSASLHPDVLEQLRGRLVGRDAHERGRAASAVLVDAGVSIEVAGLVIQRPGESVGAWLDRQPAETAAHPATPAEFELVHELRVTLSSAEAFDFARRVLGTAS